MKRVREKSTRARKNLGESGERVAALYLEEHGYQIVARNFRTRSGEVDLIAQDADGLAFIEVRTRRGDVFGSPEESITPVKRTRLLTVAQEFLQAHAEYADCPWRIDLAAIELDPAGRLARVDVIKGAVEA
jgi:putative endonuclease